MNTAVDTFRSSARSRCRGPAAPSLARGPIAWIRENLFSGPLNTLLTLAVLYLLYVLIPPAIRFLFIDAVWTARTATPAAPRPGRPVGACWAFVRTGSTISSTAPIRRRSAGGQRLLRAPRHRGRLAPVAQGPAAGPRRVYFFVVFPLVSPISPPTGASWLGPSRADRALGRHSRHLPGRYGGHRVLAAAGVLLALGRRSSCPSCSWPPWSSSSSCAAFR